MKILKKIWNLFFVGSEDTSKYTSHPEAVIIACYFNPQGNEYRLKAFNKFYESIKHLNHRIVECVIGDATPQLPVTDYITRIYTKDLLWHKEGLLNNIIRLLPSEFKYVFWLDTDVTFTNKNWFVEGAEKLSTTSNIIQPFEYCVHLERDQDTPDFNLEDEKPFAGLPQRRHKSLWRSFCANYATTDYSGDTNYDKHGHVGFAWGARREVLEAVPLYDRALIGGADHIIAHAAAGQVGHPCILKSFTDDIHAVNKWSREFFNVTHGRIGYVKGDLYHTWHGDIEKRQYLKRIQDFTPTSKEITELDENGLYVAKNGENKYVKDYFDHREDVTSVLPKEATHTNEGVIIRDKLPRGYGKGEIRNVNKINQKRLELKQQYPDRDDSFIESLLMGYFTDSTLMGTAFGGNVLGAAIGDMLNNDDSLQNQDFGERGTDSEGFQDGFGNGGFSGAGAGGEWTPDAPQDNNTDTSVSENFS